MPDWVVKYWVQWLFGGMITGLSWAVKHLSKKLKEEKNQRKALAEGLKALLRDRIIQSHNHNLDRGYCPIYEKENIQGMYEAYRELGGNGTVTGLMETIHKMRTDGRENE